MAEEAANNAPPIGRGGERSSQRGRGRRSGGGRGRSTPRDEGRGRGGGRGRPPLTKKAGASSTTPSQQHQQRQQQNETSTTADTSTQQPSQRVQGNDSKDNSNRKSAQRPETKKNPPKQNKQKQKPKQTNANSKGDSTINASGSSSPSFTTANTTTVSPHQCQQTNDLEYGKGQMITVLHIAEKPSIAQAIAKGLSVRNGEKGDMRSNKSSSLPVYEFVETKTPFPKAPHASSVCHKVTSVAGHVFSVDFPSNYQNWDAVDPAQLFDAPVRKTPTSPGIIKHLQNVAKNVDFIVLWLDCDREGENIAFECLGICMNLMKSSKSNNFDRVYRAHFSAINPSDIQKAYANLGKPDENQSNSVDARQELDLKIGIAFSRFQTKFFQGRYGDLDSAVLSYGPCQTPTLGFCVQRHIDMETFKPEPYWVLELGVSKRGRLLRALWGSGRSFNKHRVETLLSKALETPPTVAVVANVVTKDKKQGRPIPLNTVGLLKACSKALSIGPHSAMQTAERLYLSGYLSYPRTESTTYPKSFDVQGTLQQQTNDSRWGSFVRTLLSQGIQKSRGGVDMGDHPPITPCRAVASANELSGDMARVYDLVVRHFIASVSPDAIWRSTRVDFQIESLEDKGTFTVRGKELVSPGFLAVLLSREYGDEERGDNEEDDGDEEERSIPEFTKGEVIPLSNATSISESKSTKVSVASAATAVRGILEIKEKMTTPPSYLTESELIGMMEKHGIGTDASIPTHIENVQKRNYVTLESGRRLVPSKLGLVLVQGYHQIDSSLVLPQVRSDIENQCNKIAKGLASKDAVVRNALALFRGKFDNFVQKIERMDILFSSSFSKLEDVGKPFTRCGLTRRYLQYIPGPPTRLYNKWTETVYPLPSGGDVKLWTGRVCSVPDCKFELCMYSVGQPPRTFPLCPRCFNDPAWALDSEAESDSPSEDPVDRQDQAKERQIQRVSGSGSKHLVLECPLPDSHPLIDELTVGADPDDADGVLVLDPHFGPKWRFVSTREPTVVFLPNCIEKITILDKRDPEYDVRLLQIEYKDGQSPLPDASKKHVTCYSNDELLQSMSRIFRGSERTARKGGRGGRGRGGRGRGRSGRGRGRGRR